MLSLILDEYLDVKAAIDELEQRREKLRESIWEECRNERGFDHPRGRVRMTQYDAFKARETTPLIPLLTRDGWIEELLSVKGRQLYKLARAKDDILDEIRPHVRVERKTTMTITPLR